MHSPRSAIAARLHAVRNSQPVRVAMHRCQGVLQRLRAAAAYVLPDPARCTTCSAGGEFFHPAATANDVAGGAQHALEHGLFLLVVAFSPMQPESAALLAELEHAPAALLDEARRRYVTVAVDVTAPEERGELPSALAGAVDLPAAAVFMPSLRQAGELALVAVVEGVTRATTVGALMSECVARAVEEDA